VHKLSPTFVGRRGSARREFQVLVGDMGLIAGTGSFGVFARIRYVFIGGRLSEERLTSRWSRTSTLR
jgi:hypothetical protein